MPLLSLRYVKTELLGSVFCTVSPLPSGSPVCSYLIFIPIIQCLSRQLTSFNLPNLITNIRASFCRSLTLIGLSWLCLLSWNTLLCKFWYTILWASLSLFCNPWILVSGTSGVLTSSRHRTQLSFLSLAVPSCSLLACGFKCLYIMSDRHLKFETEAPVLWTLLWCIPPSSSVNWTIFLPIRQ